MICKACGKTIADDSIYCNYCKRKVHDVKSTTVYQNIMNGVYLVALLACFICDLAINHTLSWFFIVLNAIAIAWAITNLPLMVKKNRLIISAIAVSALTYLLLFTCSMYTGGDWLFSIAYPVASVSLVFAWAIIITVKFLKINRYLKAAIIMLIAAIATITLNPFVYYLIDKASIDLSAYFSLTLWNANTVGNKITFWALLCGCLITVFIGIIKHVKMRTE